MTEPRIDTTLPPSQYVAPQPDPVQHTVKDGETVESIAAQFNTTEQSIRDINPQIRDPDRLLAGDTLAIPPVKVHPAVGKAVDAVVAKEASPEQRAQAYAEVQDAVERAGAGGIAESALPAQAVQALQQAGVPTGVDPRVAKAVDAAIKPEASLDQHLAAYAEMQAYVDSVGGVSDQGIVQEALPLAAAERLAAKGVPSIAPDTIKAADRLLADDASVDQRHAAYQAVQKAIDARGGAGQPNGVASDAVPGVAAQVLTQGGHPLKFDPAVVSAVNQALPGAPGAQTLQAYERVQDVVDQADAPLSPADLKATASAAALVAQAQGQGDPQAALKALDAGYAQAEPAVQQRVLADPAARGILQQAADWATEPLGREPGQNGAGQQAPALESTRRLEQLTQGLDPALGGALLSAAIPAYEGYARSDTGAGFGPEGIQNLGKVFDRVAGTPQGDAAIKRLAQSAEFMSNQVPTTGLGPGMQAFMDARNLSATLKQHVGDYAKLTEELSWLASNHGGAMTPEQLNQAIEDLRTEKGPAWEAQVKELEGKLAADGKQLLETVAALSQAPADNATAEALLKDSGAQFAVSLALKQDPAYLNTPAGQQAMLSLADAAKGAKIGEQTLKLSREVANAWIRHNVLDAAQGFNPADPGSRAAAVASIDKLKNGTVADLLGISKSKLDNAVDALKLSLPQGQESAERIAGRLRELDKVLQTDDFKPAFDKGLPAGQLMRSLGLAFAGVGFANSLNLAATNPSLKNDLKVIVDGASLGQKGTELAIGLGKVSDDGLLGKFGSAASGRIFGVLSAGFDLWTAGEKFFAGDATRGALYTAGAIGGGLAATAGTSFAASLGIGAWAGPVGIGLVIVSAAGLYQMDRVDRSNLHMNDTSQRFLEHAGFSAEISRALVDQSGEGHSVVPALTAYANAQGYDLSQPDHQRKFVAWVEGLGVDKVSQLRDALHHKLDASDGDIEALAYATAKADLGPGASKYNDEALTQIGLPMVMGQLLLGQGSATLTPVGTPTYGGGEYI